MTKNSERGMIERDIEKRERLKKVCWVKVGPTLNKMMNHRTHVLNSLINRQLDGQIEWYTGRQIVRDRQIARLVNRYR